MTNAGTIALPREEYEALVARNEELEDRLAAIDADDGSRIPHGVALAIMRGANPVAAFRSHSGITLRDLSKRTGVAASYLSEIERGLKPGSAATLSRIANALGTTIDSLVME
jgi:lambda repressor-like predicted transcriptional regulator